MSGKSLLPARMGKNPFSLSGQQLVWQQENPLQEEHLQGSGRGQRLRDQTSSPATDERRLQRRRYGRNTGAYGSPFSRKQRRSRSTRWGCSMGDWRLPYRLRLASSSSAKTHGRDGMAGGTRGRRKEAGYRIKEMLFHENQIALCTLWKILVFLSADHRTQPDTTRATKRYSPLS